MLTILDEVAAPNGMVVDFAAKARLTRPNSTREVGAHEGVVTPVEAAKEKGEKAVDTEVTESVMVRAAKVVTELERNDNATSRSTGILAEEEAIRGQAMEVCLLGELRSRGEGII